MDFKPRLPEELQDIFHPRIYNGIHAGIGYSNIPLDPPSLEITVFELQLSPPIQKIDIHKYTKRLGYLLEVTAFGILQALFRGLNNLDKGEEIYYSY